MRLGFESHHGRFQRKVKVTERKYRELIQALLLKLGRRYYLMAVDACVLLQIQKSS